MTQDDFEQALQAERLGDAAGAGPTAAGHYRDAQRLLLPAGAVWTNREAYDRRREAFDRIQQKLYGLQGKPAETAIPVVPAAETVRQPSPARDLAVWDFPPGLAVRVCQTFADFDRQEIRAGEVLHLVERSYFPYDSGYTLTFAEKTIRLCGNVDAQEAILKNAHNAWFQPIL